MGSDQIARAARNLRTFLVRNKDLARLPMPYSGVFPKNCCEGTSCLLAFALEEGFGLADVVVVEGRHPPTDERHYWVETGGLVYDLTADQFDGCEVLVGAAGPVRPETFVERNPVERRHFDRRYVRALLDEGLLEP